MKNHARAGYGNVPRGCGLNPNTQGVMVPVALVDILATGSRKQRRWADKELCKLAREKQRQARKNSGVNNGR